MKLLVVLQSRSTLIEWSSLVLVVLSSMVRTRDVLHISRILVESSLGNCFSHFGLWNIRWLTGAERYMSLGLLLLVLISFILSTVNLLLGVIRAYFLLATLHKILLNRGLHFLYDNCILESY